MHLSPADIRLLKIIAQNIILSDHEMEGDVVDAASKKRVIPREAAHRFVDEGLAAWNWDDDYAAFRFALTKSGKDAVRTAGGDR